MSTRRQTLATDRFRRDRAAPFVRAAAATLLASLHNSFPGDMAKQHWPGDLDTTMMVRAQTSPATTSSSTWANSLASVALAASIEAMGGAFASASLLSYGIQLEFEDKNGITVPGFVADPNNLGFVGEAQPIPLRALALNGTTLTPHKLPVIAVFTRELLQRSTPNVEATVRAVLLESIGLALDVVMFSSAAASSIRPAGLLNNITPIAHSTATNPQDAMVADMKALIAAVAPIAGNGDVVLIAATDQAVALRLRQSREAYPVLASSALTAGTVIAIAPNGLASAVDPVPRFEVASEGTLVMDDAAGPLSSVGTPNTVAAPARSLFQTDTQALRIVLEISFGLRSSSAIALTTGVTW